MGTNRKHLDEARRGACEVMTRIAQEEPALLAAAIVDDLFGRITIVLWTPAEGDVRAGLVAHIDQGLAEACGSYWNEYVAVSEAASPDAETDPFHCAAWTEGRPIAGSEDKVRLNDRHRHHTAWFSGANEVAPLWALDSGPPIVVFHGFKGGAGRTTLLAGYAIAAARSGRRVAVVDVDLDAPGVGVLLAEDEKGTTARWGTLDFFLERAEALPLDDYFHVCARAPVTGEGRIEVFPAGQLDDSYLSKLGRVDLETHRDPRGHPLATLLERIRTERVPDLILLDGRAGLSPAGGLLLSGIAHLHVLVATSNEQSLRGLDVVVRHLGFQQAQRGLRQRDCVIVHALVPDSTEVAKQVRSYFSQRVEDTFRNAYYAKPTGLDEDDGPWTMNDIESEVAPHVAEPIFYSGLLAHFERIDDIADELVTRHAALHQRIDDRLGFPFAEPSPEDDSHG